MQLNALPALAAASVLLFGGQNLLTAEAVKTPSAHLQELPAEFPVLNPKRTSRPQGQPFESEFVQLWYTNRELLLRLSNYTRRSIAAEFERRMRKEKDLQVKILLAEIAAENGSVDGEKFLESLADTPDYATTYSRMEALNRLLRSPHPPEWAIDAACAALTDTREITQRRFAGTIQHVASLANEADLSFALGLCKNSKAVPVLIDMVNRGEYVDSSVEALGMIGDQRAIPVLLELLEHRAKEREDWKSSLEFVNSSEKLPRALAELHAHAAVPILLNYRRSPEVIAALGRLGDERAIEPLKLVVADDGRVDGKPDKNETSTQDRLAAAKIALVRLEKDDPVPKWIHLLKDPSLTGYSLAEVAYEFNLHPDPRAIEPLLEFVKSDPPRAACRSAISALSQHRHKRVVDGLIACFDAPLTVPSNGLEMFEGNPFQEIADALHTLTGKDFGRDKVRWKKWWDDEGKNLPSLQ